MATTRVGSTHDYNTKQVFVEDLNESHVLVGESGGLSAVFESEDSFFGQIVTTEHGKLLFPVSTYVDVYDD